MADGFHIKITQRGTQTLIKPTVMKKYNALPSLEKKILQVLSIAYAKLTQTQLVDCFVTLNIKTENGKRFDSGTKRAMFKLPRNALDNLLRDDLLNGKGRSVLVVNRAYIEILTRHLVAEKKFTAMAGILQKKLNLTLEMGMLLEYLEKSTTRFLEIKPGQFVELTRAFRKRLQALVFSQFVGHLSIVRKYLDESKIKYQYLDGSTPATQRQKAIHGFQAGEGDVFLISLKAGGVGLNLTAADYVIHLDPWWNPAVENQASDRAHRMGQRRPVTIYRLITRGTVEEKIVQMHRRKRNLADSLLAGSDLSGKMSAKELLALIQDS
jgi:SNF2 family DNA or RNA helicase